MFPKMNEFHRLPMCILNYTTLKFHVSEDERVSSITTVHSKFYYILMNHFYSQADNNNDDFFRHEVILRRRLFIQFAAILYLIYIRQCTPVKCICQRLRSHAELNFDMK